MLFLKVKKGEREEGNIQKIYIFLQIKLIHTHTHIYFYKKHFFIEIEIEKTQSSKYIVVHTVASRHAYNTRVLLLEKL